MHNDMFYKFYYYSCTKAKGLSDEKEILNALWAPFKIDELYPTGNVYLNDFDPTLPKQQITYYNKYTITGAKNFTTTGCDWDCNDFAQNYLYILNSQGFDAKQIHIEPSVYGNILLVKNWSFDGNDKSIYNNYLNYIYDVENDPTFTFKGFSANDYNSIEVHDLTGAAGQGNPDPRSDFPGHWITMLSSGEIYDPSYGSYYATKDSYAPFCGIYIGVNTEIIEVDRKKKEVTRFSFKKITKTDFKFE